MKRIVGWFLDRAGLRKARHLLFHQAPPETASAKYGWLYIFGFGAMIAFVVQAVTGVVLATKYVPSPANAYESIQFLTEEVVLGEMLRGMHYWGASAMVLFVVLHMARVFLTGSYKFPRELTWASGVIMLVLTFAMVFTGQLLRWDQNGVWTVVVGAYFVGRVPLIGDWLGQFILGGQTVSGTTLSRFFAFHVFLLPGLLVGLLGFHLYLVLHHGISELPRAGRLVDPRTYTEQYQRLMERYGRPYWPDAAWKEVVFGAGLAGVIALLAIALGPRELAPPPDPTDLTAEPKPDWYLLWYYTLITLKPPGLEDLFMVYLPVMFLMFLLVFPFMFNRGERSPSRRPWAIIVVAVAFLGITVLIGLGQRAPWIPNYDTQPLSAQAIESTDEQVYEGAQLFYAKGCQYCHTVAGEGGRYGPDLTHVAKRLSPEEIRVRTVQGIGDMPPYRDALTADELNDILALLQHLSASDTRAEQ